ncbi:MAG: hypothetical protein V4582_22020 [Pseudomonadota bacterium]
MYALRVRVNGEEPVVAGADDLGVLTATVNCVGKLGSASHQVRDDEDADLFLSVGGLTSRPPDMADEHVRWVSLRALHVGDVINVEIIETPNADAPIGGEQAAKKKHDEREYFEHCKRTYFALRERFES